MNRREFLKQLLLVGGCAGLACGGKFLWDYNSESTLPNGIKLEKKYLIEKYKDKSELPKLIRIDACTLCQLNCPCCGRNDIVKGCGLGYLSFENFKKIVDDNNFAQIELSNKGEIFLNPELLDIIKYAYDKNIMLTANTGVNMNYLSDQVAEALVKYQFRELMVSIDGATPETYSIYRRGGNFDQVISNIRKINYYKEKYNSDYPMMVYKFILFGHNEHEIDKAKELASSLGMLPYFHLNWDPSYSPIKNIELVQKKTGINVESFMIDDLIKKYKTNSTNWFFCKELWLSPQINWDGKILGCCSEWESDFGGNAFKDGLLNALNNPKMIYAKNMLTGNAEPIEGIPCTYCCHYKNLKKFNLTIKPITRGANPII